MQEWRSAPQIRQRLILRGSTGGPDTTVRTEHSARCFHASAPGGIRRQVRRSMPVHGLTFTALAEENASADLRTRKLGKAEPAARSRTRCHEANRKSAMENKMRPLV